MRITTKSVCTAWDYAPVLLSLQHLFALFVNRLLPTSLIFFSVLYGASASAGSFIVFGPQSFQRSSGASVTETVNFNVLDPSATYNIILYNGGIEDDEVTGQKVSSGIISINGTNVIQQSNFSQNTGSVSETVSLQGDNNLSVTLKGKPGGLVTILITGEDNTPPVITASINPAPDSSGWNYSSVTVSFECSDATSGISSCSDPVVLNTDGAAQQVIGVATDNAGNTASTTVTVNISLDQDDDGVSNNNDSCPDTPAGEVVNADGCSPSQLDTDTDGVSDAIDQCANTPAGESVNANGCSLTQLDTDNDGVNDALDQCENTPAGEAVNVNGCSPSQLDADNDGVSDAIDQCANTPIGEAVNANGCSLTQLDTDSDGVNDALDQCANTPVGETVNVNGCSSSQLDADNDGVSDAIDQCATTPTGEAVDVNGCGQSQIDDDDDGVFNSADVCVNTPVGETVDANGCSPSQLDADNDGISDAIDQCANTPTGETVNSNGCSLTQLDTDNDGVNNATDQCSNTPAGESVDANGCAQSQLDDDNDGVFNTLDICVNTSAGEIVDANGCSATQLDADNDGVNDATDQCANTPTGETVNAVGCSLTQLDTDNDGVNDAIDQCANTPSVETVNAVGCSLTQLDSDGDGVNDAFDQCVDTPAGETVNTNGCSSTQLDADNDGVSDAIDQCADTPTIEVVNANGCSPSQLDSDNDGVNDVFDQCMNTPAGESVDANGCAQSQLDADNDGVFNTLDACANTPAGETVDANGCSATQLDADNDGVNDATDQCANTPAGETVNADGCSLTQLDSDSDGISDELDQCADTTFGETVDELGCSDSQKDTDSDGVNDAFDQCPNTTAGSTVDADGCSAEERDDDNDGVTNDTDICPNTPVDEVVDINGCSEAQRDDDNDGVANGLDQCPNTVSGTPVEADGCDETQRDSDSDGVLDIYDAFPNDPAHSELPKVTIDSPATLTTVGSKTIVVTGTADEGVSLTVNNTSVTPVNGAYTANVVLEEGHNTIVTKLVTSDGVISTASISISLDLTPPYITVESHTDGQVVNTATVAIAGLVNDIVRGTVEDAQANVLVNGVQAAILNRSYQAVGITLVEGDNLISILAADQVGNTSEVALNLVYQPVVGQHIEIISGQNQSGIIEAELGEALVVKVLDNNSQPVINKNVVFRIIQGAGILGVGTVLEGRGVVVQTDINGLAQTSFKLGYRSGAGNQKVRVRVVGYDDEVIFYANANANIADKLSVNSGNNQRGSNFQLLPAPFVVAATDIGSNVVQGSRVEFKVIGGNGKFNGGDEINNGQTITVVTDSDGRASAHLQLGGVIGLDRQRVIATLLDGPEGVNIIAGFNASAFAPGEAGLTSITGIILDNQDNPLEGATIRVDGTSRQAIADIEGKFTITEAPVGPVHLIVDGSTTIVEGEYPSLSYNIVTVSGVENPLSAPIYMVKLNTDNAVYAGQADVTLELPEAPGFKLEVPAGSVTFPDGSKEGLLSVTVVNSSKIPMAPPNGMQPQFIVTIQPTGAQFDPPARLSLPNVDGHVPGRQVEMFSYDHDLEEFVTIGLGTVSEDATIVRSNPGVGVIKAGWHCGAQPGGSGCCEGGSGDCGKCGTSTGECGSGCKQIPGCCDPEPDCSAKCEQQKAGTCACEAIPNCCDPDPDCEFCQKANTESCSCEEDPSKENSPLPEQKKGDCSIATCGGPKEDLTDNPQDSGSGDNPNDCVNTVCEGPPEPDDGETPDADCTECKGGSASPVTGHVQKRKQSPDDCLTLYCDGNHEPALNESTQVQTPFDCQEVVCDGTTRAANDPPIDKPDDCKQPTCENKKIVIINVNDPPADTLTNDCFHPVCENGSDKSEFFIESLNDTNQLDCKAPICDATTKGKGEQLASNQKPQDENVDSCNKKIYECTQVGGAISLKSEIDKITGAPLDGQKCIKCVDGVSSKNYDDTPVTYAGSLTSNPGIGVILKKSKSALSRIGLGDLVEGIAGKATVTRYDCCNEITGPRKDGVQETAGGMTVKIYAKSKHVPSLGYGYSTDGPIDIKIGEVDIDFHLGIVVDADAEISAELGHTLDSCNGEDCYTAKFTGGFTITPKLTASGIICLNSYLIDEKSCGGIEITPAAFPIGFNADMKYNLPCDSDWTGDICLGSVKYVAVISFNIPGVEDFRKEVEMYKGGCF